MYKLLTDEQKKIVSREYKLRRVAIILYAVIILAIIQLAGLFPSHVLSNVREKEVRERLTLLNNMELTEEDRNLFSWISDFNIKLKLLSPNIDTDKPSQSIEDVINARVTGIKITSIDWIKEEGKESMSISGIASDRQSLIAFERSVEEAGLGEAVVPVSNLAKDRDIAFTLKLVPTKIQ